MANGKIEIETGGKRISSSGCCDFVETFSSMVKHDTAKELLSIALSNNWVLK